MPEFATFLDLTRFQLTLNESVVIKSASAQSVNKTVFLAYSSKDSEYRAGVISVLESSGGRVYIDKADATLPRKPNRKTAEVLRSSIRSCRRFVIFFSTNSKDSVQIPWELGLADGEKGHALIALFPTASNSTDQNWASQEYLGLYQVVVWGIIDGVLTQPDWIVLNRQSSTAVTLNSWLAQSI